MLARRALLVICFWGMLGCSTTVLAATLHLSPSSGEKTVGSVFPVQVVVKSSNQAMNAAGAVVSFPTDKLEVVSLSTQPSIINFWVQNPAFSNAQGTVSFEGVAVDPGYIGGYGQILTINFRVKTAGTASVTLGSGTVLANDGAATSILAGMGTASFTLVTSAVQPTPVPTPKPTPTPTPQVGGLEAPEITSTTHPDESSWYNNNEPYLSWVLPDETTAVQTLLDHNANSRPSVVYTNPINEKKIDALDDGVWYFHVRLKDSVGWGETAHFKLQIDTQGPQNITIEEVERDIVSPTVSFKIFANDELSGISWYEIQVDNRTAETWGLADEVYYTTEILPPGEHVLHVRVVDQGGNTGSGWQSFEIQGLDAPLVEEYTQHVDNGGLVYISGTSQYPGSIVYAQFKSNNGENLEYSTNADAKTGAFVFEIDNLPEGTYSVQLRIEDSEGSQSYLTESFEVVVGMPGFYGISRSTLWLALLPIFVLLIILLLLLLYSHHKVERLSSSLSKKVETLEHGAKDAMLFLERDVTEQVAILKKKTSSSKLTREERELVDSIKTNLEEHRAFLQKESRYINKAIKESEQ